MNTASRPLVPVAVMLVLLLAACRPRPAEPPPAPPPPPPEVPVARAAYAEPQIAAMALASVSSKLGVPVDLRYQFEGDVEEGRPVTLHLAAVPRVAGSNLVVSIKEEAGIEARAGALRVQKASATDAYRQQLSVTRLAGGPQRVRVLVTMDLPEGSAFGYYTVPFVPGAPALKSDRVEQH